MLQMSQEDLNLGCVVEESFHNDATLAFGYKALKIIRSL